MTEWNKASEPITMVFEKGHLDSFERTGDRDLGVSSRTVDAHRYQISRRLQVHDVAGMVRYAIRNALFGSEP